MNQEQSVVVHLGKKVVKLNFRGFDSEVDVDEWTYVDHGNLYGEAVTIPTLVNKVGILEAEAEREYNEHKMELSILESKIEIGYRAESSGNAGKFKIGKDSEGNIKWVKMSNDSIAAAIKLNLRWQKKIREVYDAKKDWQSITALYKGVQSKDRKLNNLIRSVTPEELGNEIIEETINNIVIKKRKSITE